MPGARRSTSTSASPTTRRSRSTTTSRCSAPAPAGARAAAETGQGHAIACAVDLLKLLDIDSSLAARKELAKELRCPDKLMADSAQMIMWLHKNVLAHIAANGGNVPAELLH